MSMMPPPITGITSDSRLVQAGYMFVAIVGHKMDGRQFIDDAVARGATVIAVPKGTPQQNVKNISWIEVDNPRLFLAEQAAQFYRLRPPHIVAVTGTNGKTSTVNFCRQLWSGLGIKGASLGTLGLLADGISDYNGMTTPDAVELHKALKLLSDHAVTHVALEASSQGMDQDRLHGLKFKVAAFTNLTQDHLDYHHTMEDYLTAKLQLVRELLAEDGVAVLNADDTAHIDFLNICKTREITAWTYGFSGKELQLIKREPVADGQILDIKIFGEMHHIYLPLVGLFQTMNVLCALGIVCADKNIHVPKAISLLETLEGIPGRLQKVKHSIENIGVYIDYAHTPDG
ncbi:MAG: UDP-N-acetylmuramoyl-L-alanyl-D-glutamate--2,6-diaminopimelate ligase, partial [Pseudomonadota bacterium]